MLKRITGIIGWVGIGIIFGAFVLWFARPEWERAWMRWAGLACLLVYIAGQWREIAEVFTKRQARFGTAAVLSVLALVGILTAVNYLGARENKRWDVTAGGVYTLSEQTQKLLSKLDAPLAMTVFAKEADFERYRNRLSEYPYASKQVTVKYVDLDKAPELGKEKQVQSYGTITLEYKGRIERVVSDNEQDLANGIVKVITGEQKKVLFVQGHGERDTAMTERSGYSGIATALGRENYQVDKLILAQQEVPADASVVVVAGPTADFLPGEVERLKTYLQRGGKVLLLLDPPEKADSAPLTNLLALAREWDIQVNSDIVIDLSGIGQLFGASEAAPVAGPPYPNFPIAEGFRYLTAYPLARSVTPIAGGVNGRNAQSFIQTSPNSWAADAARVLKDKKVEINETTDKKGPISLAAAVSAPLADQPAVAPAKADQKPKVETRVAVVGDSDFAANYALGTQGNKDLFMNTVGWLAQQENLISVRPKEPEDRRLTMTVSDQRAMLVFSLLIVPGLIIVSGVYAWWRRR